MILLDLFCKAGGAAMGYHRAGFRVVGVDIEKQKNYPFEFVQADAMLWRGFVDLCAAGEHSIVCVTARRDTDENRETISEWMESHGINLRVYFTGLGSKVDYMQSRGLHVDIWIDDDPRKCALGH